MLKYMVFCVTIMVSGLAFAQNENIENKLVTDTFKAGEITFSVLLDSRRPRDLSIIAFPAGSDIRSKLPENYIVDSDNIVLMAQYKNQTVLFDTGNGIAARGQLMNALAEAKVKPQDISAVFITHMHGDHIGGLLIDGKPAFPKATIYVPQEEADYWLPKDFASVPEDTKPRLENGMKIFEALWNAKQKVVFFKSGSDMSKYFGNGAFEFKSITAFGHTPGHTVYMLSSKGSTVVDWGDLLHMIDVQLWYPELSSTYDMDKTAAAKSREKVLQTVKEKNVLVTGTHIVFPGVFRVVEEGDGGYMKVPR